MSSLLGKALQVRNQGTPVPLGGASSFTLSSLSLGGSDQEAYMRAFGTVGTVWQIVHLLASNTAKPQWKLFQKAPQDGRQRYTTSDQGSDQRKEVIKHQALTLLLNPNPFYSRFQLMEASQQYLELTGESWWVIDRDPRSSIPLGMWPVRPDRMDPVPDPKTYLKGYVYSAPDGLEKVPLQVEDVLLVRYPNPLDPYRGLGPVQAVLVDIDAAKYAAEWNRNFFVNSARPDGVVQVPHTLTDEEFTQLSDRWREAHKGVSRAHRVAFLEAGATWQQVSSTLKDMDFVNLRNSSRDLIREAWGIHKIMLGNSDDVNRANAQTGEEVFANWSVSPRLDRWKEALNTQYLPLFGTAGDGVEFDYIYPLPQNREQDNAELQAKSQAALLLTQAGYDRNAVLQVVGLPDMPVPAPARLPGPITGPAALPGATQQSASQQDAAQQDDSAGDAGDGSQNRLGWAPQVPGLLAKKNVSAKVYQQLSSDYPVGVLGWVHYAQWMGPLKVPLSHLDMTSQGGSKSRFGRTEADIGHFKQEIADKGKTKPVVLVKRPGLVKLLIVDGHARVLAYSDLKLPVRAFVGAVDADEGPWDTMHDHQLAPAGASNLAAWPPDLEERLRRVLSNGHVPVQTGAA